MPILLYCISHSSGHNTTSLIGVAGMPVTHTRTGELIAFYSIAPDTTIWLQRPLHIAAIEVHRVCNDVFKSAAIIPFRFPTIFETERDLEKHLIEESAEYDSILTKFRNLVQMEVRITGAKLRNPVESGTDYLQRRQQSIRAAERFSYELQQRASGFVAEWRHRSIKDGVRAFALVKRNEVGEFQNSMRLMYVPDGLAVRVSGPWPVSEFIEQG